MREAARPPRRTAGLHAADGRTHRGVDEDARPSVKNMRRDIPPASKVPLPAARPAGTGVWVLELPFLTPLSLNDRDKWVVKWRKTKPWRDAAHQLARGARIPPCARITIQLMYVPRDDRARDPLNLVASLKAVEDGLVDAKVIPDDSSRYHTSVMPQITRKGPARANGNRFWVIVTAHG